MSQDDNFTFSILFTCPVIHLICYQEKGGKENSFQMTFEILPDGHFEHGNDRRMTIRNAISSRNFHGEAL